MDQLLPLLESFQSLMRDAVEYFGQTFPLVQSFWQDGYQRYLRKMKVPKYPHPTKPRRHFHLSAVDHLLAESQPSLVWNLCTGNINTIVPVLERWASAGQVWLNVDLLAELQEYNTQALERRWGVTRERWGSLTHVVRWGGLTVVNLQGTVEDFVTAYTKAGLDTFAQRQVLVCVDGFPNTALDPSALDSWWRSVKALLGSSMKGWYYTWLNAESLATKFAFYYDVAVQKHNHPLHWLEATPLQASPDQSSLRVGTKPIVSPLNPDTYSFLKANQPSDWVGWVFRFYTDDDMEDLAYQACYLLPSAVERWVNLGGQSKVGRQLTSYDTLGQQLRLGDCSAEEGGFVKILPVWAVT